MAKKQQRKLQNNGMIITVTFVVIVVGLLISAHVKLKNLAYDRAVAKFTEVSTEYSEDLNARADLIFALMNQSAYHMSSKDLMNSAPEERQIATEAIMSSGLMDSLWITIEGGRGFDESGEPINLQEMDITPELSDHRISLCKTEEGNKFLFCVHAEDLTGLPFDIIGVVDAKSFVKLINKADFDTTAVVLLVGENGDIWSQTSNKTYAISSDNIWKYIPTSDLLDNFKTKYENKKSANVEITIPGKKESQVLFSSPIGETGTSFAVILNRSTIDRTADKDWKVTRQIFVTLYVLFALFVAIHFINGSRAHKEHSESTKVLQDKADKDLLTGLNNKIATERKIKEYMEENPNVPCMMLLVDVDDFKRINDTKGHAFGDTVLKELGMGLGGLFRYTDIVGRIGGDEFMIFLKNIESEEVMYHEAEKLIRFFDDFKAGTEYIKYSATASIGAASYPVEGADFDALYKATDKALYKSKKNGKKQLNFFNEDMHTVKV